ncbi:MAG: ABC transporter permease [Acidobacteriota bacterium]|nr:ABC transporter permease [Acidobacteriota bacterium]
MANVRLAFRVLLKTPVVTGVAILSLSLGIGANAAIFSLYSQLLLRPLPVLDPERLVNLAAPGPKGGSSTSSCDGAGECDEVFSYPMFRDLQRDQRVFTDIVAHRGFDANATYQGQTVNIRGMQVSGSYFSTLGLAPLVGRLFGPEVDEPIGGHPVVVVSHEFWQSTLGGTRDALGEALVVNGQPLTIVGVAPAGFQGTTLNQPSAIFVPLSMHGSLSLGAGAGRFENRQSYWLYLFARLEQGVSRDQARAGMEPRYRSVLAEMEAPLLVGASDDARARFVAKPLAIEDGRRGQNVVYDVAGPRLFLLFVVTAIVLLIACANIANLLLARSAARASEMAVRLAIGASRRHLLAQLLTESCVLAIFGGAAGLLAALWTLRFIGVLLPPEVVEYIPLTVDPYAVPFSAALALVTGVLFGLFPAFHGTRSALISVLKDEAGQPGGARSAAGFRQGLVVAQFALAAMLLMVGGLFIQSLRNQSRVDLGIQTADVVAFRLSPALDGAGDSQVRSIYERVEEALAAQPGVTAATAASTPLLAGSGQGTSVMVEGFEAGPATNRSTRFNQIGTGYFRTLGIPLLAGRTFTESDVRGAPRVAVVNEAFARRFGLGREAVGRRLGRGGLDAALDTEIVGLVADARQDSLRIPAPPLLYVHYRQEEAIGSVAFYVRSALPATGLLRSIPPLVAEFAPNLPVTDLKTLQQQVEETGFQDRAMAVLSAAFAAIATLLAAIGLYGVLAYTVAQRTREIGLRMALGASAARLRAMVLGQVARMTLAGGAFGYVVALGLARVAQSMLYEVDGLPPVVVAAAGLVLTAVALAAGLVPAHRAARVDPMNALRHR